MGMIAFILLEIVAMYIVESKDNQKSIFYENYVLIALALMVILIIGAVIVFI